MKQQKQNKYKKPDKKGKAVQAGRQEISAPEIIQPDVPEKNNKLIYAVIFILTFVLYGNTLMNDYALDDAIVITQNQFTKKGIDGIKDIFNYDTFIGFWMSSNPGKTAEQIQKEKKLVAGGRYRPMSLATFAIEWEFFRNSPGLSHFINILLYALTGILLYIVLSKLLARYETKHWYFSLPFFSSLLFIAHPIHTEVIANIKGRDEIMTFLGALAAMYFTLKYLETDKKINLLYSSVSLFLGLMSKENAITFLAVIPLAIYFFTDHSFKKSFITLIPLFVASLVFLIIRQKILGSFSAPVARELMNNPFLYMTGGQQLATIIYTLGIYVKLLFLPHPLTFDYYPYQIPIMNWSDIQTIIAFLVYVAIGIYALVGFSRKSIISFSLIFYLATISVVSNILFPVGTFMNERFIYISSLGFCIIIVYLVIAKIPMFMKKEKAATSLIAILLFIILFSYSIKTISRNFDWKNDFTLFTNDVKVSSNSAKSNCSAGGKLIEEAIKPGNEAMRKEYLELALQYLKKSVEIHPPYSDALLLLGNAYYEYNKDYDNTLAAYKKILVQNPNYDRVFTNLDIIFAKNDNVDYKIKVWEDLYQLNQDRFEINYNLGQLYGRYKNDMSKAIPFLEKAVQKKPSNVAASKDLGVAYGMIKEFKKSAEVLEKAASLDANDDQIFYNLYITYMQLNQKDKADVCLKKAEQIKARKAESEKQKVKS
ncbi:MAG: hypothetical protein HY958_05085 [Bacteroidia bacterium]|nr:hypothetical protein [Bacteroidia bacterium]